MGVLVVLRTQRDVPCLVARIRKLSMSDRAIRAEGSANRKAFPAHVTNNYQTQHKHNGTQKPKAETETPRAASIASKRFHRSVTSLARSSRSRDPPRREFDHRGWNFAGRFPRLGPRSIASIVPLGTPASRRCGRRPLRNRERNLSLSNRRGSRRARS